MIQLTADWYLCHSLHSSAIYVLKRVLWNFINSMASGGFRGFLGKKRLNARGFAREYLRSCSGYGPGQSVKTHGKSSSLHLKKNFLLGGCRFFVSDVIIRGLLGHVGPIYRTPALKVLIWHQFRVQITNKLKILGSSTCLLSISISLSLLFYSLRQFLSTHIFNSSTACAQVTKISMHRSYLMEIDFAI